MEKERIGALKNAAKEALDLVAAREGIESQIVREEIAAALAESDSEVLRALRQANGSALEPEDLVAAAVIRLITGQYPQSNA